MAKRGPSHNFIKQEKERKRLKKAALKTERRNLKKQQSAADTDPDSNESVVDSDGDGTDLEDSEVETVPGFKPVLKASDSQ